MSAPPTMAMGRVGAKRRLLRSEDFLRALGAHDSRHGEDGGQENTREKR